MGNCIQKQRERELAKRALRRDELVSYFFGKDGRPAAATADGQAEKRLSPGGRASGRGDMETSSVSTPPMAETSGESGMAADEAAASSATDTAAASSATSAAAVVAAAALAAAAAASSSEEQPGWQLTDRQREAALYSMENDGIERLHDNAELQLEQRRERQRREERLRGFGVSGIGGITGCGGGTMWDDAGSRRGTRSPTAYLGGGGAGCSRDAATGFHGARHVSFGGVLDGRSGGHRK